MTEEMKVFISTSIKKDIIFGVIISCFLLAFLGSKISFIFLLGIIIAGANFALSGIILDKSLNGGVSSRVLITLGTIIRIFIILIIAIPFSSNIMYLLSYLGGFIIHFPILIFSYIRKQKGSE